MNLEYTLVYDSQLMGEASRICGFTEPQKIIDYLLMTYVAREYTRQRRLQTVEAGGGKVLIEILNPAK